MSQPPADEEVPDAGDSATSGVTHLLDLPVDVLLHLISHALPAATLLALDQCCRLVHSAVSRDHVAIWQGQLNRRFPSISSGRTEWPESGDGITRPLELYQALHGPLEVAVQAGVHGRMGGAGNANMVEWWPCTAEALYRADESERNLMRGDQVSVLFSDDVFGNRGLVNQVENRLRRPAALPGPSYYSTMRCEGESVELLVSPRQVGAHQDPHTPVLVEGTIAEIDYIGKSSYQDYEPKDPDPAVFKVRVLMDSDLFDDGQSEWVPMTSSRLRPRGPSPHIRTAPGPPRYVAALGQESLLAYTAELTRHQ